MESAQPNDNVLQLSDDDDIVLPNHSLCAKSVGLSAKKAEQTKFRKYSAIEKLLKKFILWKVLGDPAHTLIISLTF